jgi:hypothetical protein
MLPFRTPGTMGRQMATAPASTSSGRLTDTGHPVHDGGRPAGGAGRLAVDPGHGMPAPGQRPGSRWRRCSRGPGRRHHRGPRPRRRRLRSWRWSRPPPTPPVGRRAAIRWAAHDRSPLVTPASTTTTAARERRQPGARSAASSAERTQQGARGQGVGPGVERGQGHLGPGRSPSRRPGRHRGAGPGLRPPPPRAGCPDARGTAGAGVSVARVSTRAGSRARRPSADPRTPWPPGTGRDRPAVAPRPRRRRRIPRPAAG